MGRTRSATVVAEADMLGLLVMGGGHELHTSDHTSPQAAACVVSRPPIVIKALVLVSWLRGPMEGVNV
eukprot:SAG31_NODE_101_length_25195_cov_67.436758_3_plen_68_part_00